MASWVDGPLPLIAVPTTKDPASHRAIAGAIEMVHVHNALIRGLNAIYLQAPHVASSDQPSYNEKDVKDLLYYINAWVHVVEHHHSAEEEVFFPELEKLSGELDIMNNAKQQHEAFHDGLHKLEEFSTRPPKAYDWTVLKTILDDMSEPFMTHLKDEIVLLLSLDRLDNAGFADVWQKTEDHAKASGNMALMFDMFPLVLGCCDRKYWFPPLPGALIYAINYVFWYRHRGAWRFNPSDGFGRPRPLQMVSA